MVDSKVALMYLIKMWTVARNGGQIESKEGVASSKLFSIDVVSFVLKHRTHYSNFSRSYDHRNEAGGGFAGTSCPSMYNARKFKLCFAWNGFLA